MRSAIIICGALSWAACNGDRVEGTPETGVASDGGGDAAACTTTPGNLVQNGSFEIAPGGVLAGWAVEAKGSAIQRMGGAADCRAWAEVNFPPTADSAYFEQDLRFDSALPKGTTLHVAVSLRTLDAILDAVVATGILGSDYGAIPVTLPADGSWKRVTLDWVVPSDGQKNFSVSIISKSPTTHTLGVDDVSFVVTPP